MKRDIRRRPAGFTLVELLTVIAILAVLAALAFLAGARVIESGRNGVCLGNLRTVGAALLAFAADNNGWTPHAYQNVQGTWADVLVKGGYLPPLKDGLAHPLICPSQQPKVARVIPGVIPHTYGMRNISAGGNNKARFRLNLGVVKDSVTFQNVSWGAPSKFLLLGDSILNLPGNAYNGYQSYFFDAGGSSGFRAVHLRHNGKGNFLFGDGHVRQLGKEDLVGNYGGYFDASGSPYNVFVPGAINESAPR